MAYELTNGCGARFEVDTLILTEVSGRILVDMTKNAVQKYG